MSTANHIGRIGALAIALGIGNFRSTATRVAVSIGAAALVATGAAAPLPVSPAVKLSADSTALLVCGGACPKFDDASVDIVMNQFITPTHPGETITPVAVTTPSEYWPLTGVLRLVGLAFGDPRLTGLGGPSWPDEPWWKLSGLFDLTENQSQQVGVADLETAMTEHGNNHLVIYGYSEGAGTVVLEKRKLAEQYPAGTNAPDITFVLGGDTNLPNGGISARFAGLHVPILDILFDGAEPTNTPFHTDVITRQYDGAADFPLYPLNVVADLNAVLGFLYLHTHPFDVSLPADPTTSPAYQGTHGDSSYYFFQTQDLPLFDPLRQLGVPEQLIDVVQPFFRAIVEMGYDRSIPPWQPTPARLFPTLDPARVAVDLVNAIGECIKNAAALVDLPPLTRMPAPASTTQTAKTTSTAASATESSSTGTPAASASASTPNLAKPAGQPATPRPVLRATRGVFSTKLPDLSHQGNGGLRNHLNGGHRR